MKKFEITVLVAREAYEKIADICRSHVSGYIHVISEGCNTPNIRIKGSYSKKEMKKLINELHIAKQFGAEVGIELA